MGLLTPIAVRIGAISWMPKLLPQVVWLDTNLQKADAGGGSPCSTSPGCPTWP